MQEVYCAATGDWCRWQREAPGMATLLVVGQHVLHVQASFDISIWGFDKLYNKRQNLNNIMCLKCECG